MLDQNDIAVLRGMFRENNIVLRKEMRQEFREDMRTMKGEIIEQVRDEIHRHVGVAASCRTAA